MNIDKYLRLKIGNFQNANEPLLGIFNSIAKFLDLEVPVVTIRSKKGDIYQVVQDDGSRFILWDMTYWDTFSHYLDSRLLLDAGNVDIVSLFKRMSLNFCYYFAGYSSTWKNTEHKLMRHCWVNGYNPNNKCLPTEGYFEECLTVCKIFAYMHEIYHAYFGCKPAMKKPISDRTRHSLNRWPVAVHDILLDFVAEEKSHIEKQEAIEIVDRLMKGEDDISEEVLADAGAFYQTSYLLFTMFFGNNRDAWPMLIPKIRNCIFEFRQYSSLLTSLKQMLYNIEFRWEESPEEILERHKQRTIEIIHREFVDLFVELDQLGMLFPSFDMDQLLKAYDSDTMKPYRKNYFKYVKPYFEDFTKEYLIPILIRP